MRQFENGVLSSARVMPTPCDANPRGPATGGTWMKCSLKINGRLHYLWRAVDQDADVLDILVQSRRNKKAAKKFFSQIIKRIAVCSAGGHHRQAEQLQWAAGAEVIPSVEHFQQKYQNNRAENSHQPTRLRERAMRQFKSAGHAQRFLSAFGIITSLFRVGRHLY